MNEKFPQIPETIWNFIIKVLPFSLAALAIQISVQIRNKKATLTSVVLSVIIGLSAAWITGGFVYSHFSQSASPIVIGVITITSEKIGYYFVYRFDFNTFFKSFLNKYLKK